MDLIRINLPKNWSTFKQI
jgi:hypothetical protein